VDASVEAHHFQKSFSKVHLITPNAVST